LKRKEEMVIEDKEFFEGTKLVEKKWNQNVGIKNVISKIDKFSFPKKPTTFGDEYQFPEEISMITLNDLGKWLFKLAGWKGYSLRLLGISEIEESILDDTYSVSISKKMSEIESDKRIVKEMMIGKIISENEPIKNLKIKLIEKSAEVLGLKRLVELYSIQLEVISREISRRQLDLKQMHGKEF